jgi:hypothetical protein
VLKTLLLHLSLNNSLKKIVFSNPFHPAKIEALGICSAEETVNFFKISFCTPESFQKTCVFREGEILPILHSHINIQFNYNYEDARDISSQILLTSLIYNSVAG